MADSPITRKLHPSGSLTRRVLMMVLLLLVIPLFLQNFFLYRQEYQQKVEEIQTDLQFLAGERAYLIEELLQMDWRLLEQTANAELSARNVKQLYIERIPLPPNAKNRFVAISKSREALLAGIAESDTSALIIPIPFSIIAKELPRLYPIEMDLVDEEGGVLWASAQETKEEYLAAESPVGETGVRVKLSVEEAQIQGLHLQSYYLRFATLVFFVGGVGGILVFLFTRRIAKPLRSLCKAMERVSQGASHVRYLPDWMGFEINALGLQFNETLDGLLKHAAEAEKERLHRERLAKELSIGHEIQAGLVPKHAPGFHGLDIASHYLAAKEVNGDFYDLFKLPDGRLLIALCDTAGKGISACLFSLDLRSILRSLASLVSDLSELVQRANDLYTIDAQATSMFSTLWIGLFDPKEKKLTFCSQGHPPALLVRGAQIEELWTAGIALGASKVDTVPTKEIKLMAGDFLILYSDGVIEAHNGEQQLFGKARFYESLTSKQRSTAEKMADQILEEVQGFVRGAPQHDDITLLVLKISH